MPADVISPESHAAAAAEPMPGASKFVDSMKANIAAIGQPDAPAIISPPPPEVKPPAAAPAAPAAKPAEPPAKPAESKADDDDVELPKNISGAKAEDWQKLISQRDKHKTKAQALAEQLKAKDDEIVKFKTKPQVDPEVQTKLEALQKERDEFSERLERAAMENHPKFQAHFNARFEQAVNDAKAAAGDKSDQMLAILEAPASKWRKQALEEIVTGMESEVDKATLMLAVRDYDKIRAEKKALLDNSKTEAARLREVEAQERGDREKKMAAARENNVNYALQKAREVDAFKPIEGDTAHNEAVAVNEAALKRFLTTVGTKDMTLDDFIQAPIQAAEARRLKVIVDTVTKERDELKKAVAAYQQANPGARSGGQTATATNNNGGVDDPTPFKTAANRALREAGII